MLLIVVIEYKVSLYNFPITNPPIVVFTDSSAILGPKSLIEIQVEAPVGGNGKVDNQVAPPPCDPCPPA